MVADISCIPSVNATEFVFETVWHMIVTVCWVSVDESHWNKQTELREKLLSSFLSVLEHIIRSVSPAELQQTHVKHITPLFTTFIHVLNLNDLAVHVRVKN